MELNHIKGNTYYIKDNDNFNVGLYKIDERRCLLIDVGYEEAVQPLLEYLSMQDLLPAAVINTHGHVDHAGGDALIKKLAGVRVYASEEEALIIEKPELEMLGLTGVPSFGSINGLFLKGRHCKPDYILKPGSFLVDGVRLDALALPGHAIGHMGIATPDNVLFCGDAVFTHGFIKKYKLPYISDVAATITSLKAIKRTSYEYYIPSHGHPFDDIKSSVEENIRLIENVINYISDKLHSPIRREDLCAMIMEHYRVWMSFPQHFLMMCYTSAFLRYLYEDGKIEPVTDGYSLKWRIAA